MSCDCLLLASQLLEVVDGKPSLNLYYFVEFLGEVFGRMGVTVFHVIGGFFVFLIIRRGMKWAELVDAERKSADRDRKRMRAKGDRLMADFDAAKDREEVVEEERAAREFISEWRY